jgi:L-alanine-DL-glutamate epimerase-like enolase superfamily enzyme
MEKTVIRPVGVRLHLLPVETRVPLKFGTETLTSVTCARVAMTVEDQNGNTALGWGETPLSVQWVWPSKLSYSERYDAMVAFCKLMVDEWLTAEPGHPLECGYAFQEDQLPRMLASLNADRTEKMPWLAALVCASAFDIALHDAYGNLLGRDVYDCYGSEYLGSDLAAFLEPADDGITFAGKYPVDFLTGGSDDVRVWHLVGGHDALGEDDRPADAPDDGYPVTLEEWIREDGLKCLKIKLRGNDEEWDYQRLLRIGEIGIANGVEWLTTDFNCTVLDPAYVCRILDRLLVESPRIYGMILYVEQPFPYELDEHPIDVHSVSARKPLFMDESAHDWKQVRKGRALGWTGVALKTCKTQTGALLSLCWAKAHGMTLMVQDLTNPMLAQIPHVRLGAHAGTIMGVESNGMQFYPEASLIEAAVHPGIYQRRNGVLDLSTLGGSGFGYKVEEINRQIPEAIACT